MDKHKKLAGKKFGNLLVIERTDNNKHGNICWLCKCDCGTEKIIIGRKLYKNITTCCGCMKKPKNLTEDLTGKTFGNLYVLERSKSYSKYPMWLCLCVCGSKKSIRGESLKRELRGSKSCGCLHPKKPHTDPKAPMLSSARAAYNQRYKDGDLSFDDFFELSQKNCNYCNSPPKNKKNIFFCQESTQFSKDNGYFIYNGLDRIDSSKPHNKDNVTPCCFQCNWSKSNKSVIEFENWALKIIINMCNKDMNNFDKIKEALKNKIK